MGDSRTILAVMGLEANTSNRFRHELLQMADRLGMSADDIAAVMAFETGGTFDPSLPNKNSGAIGLIQFTEMRAGLAGTTRAALAKMTAVQQLEYVERAFAPMKGRVHTLTDCYMVVLAPSYVGRPGNTGIYFKDADTEYGRNAYEWNAGLDQNKDGIITVQEAASPVTTIATAAAQRPRIVVTKPTSKGLGLLPSALLMVSFILGIRRWKTAARG